MKPLKYLIPILPFFIMGCAGLFGTDCSKLPITFNNAAPLEYFYTNNTQYLMDFNSNRIPITKKKTKLDTVTTLTSYDGCAKYSKYVNTSLFLSSPDSLLDSLAIIYSYNSYFSVRIKNISSDYLLADEFTNTVTIGGTTYTKTMTFFLHKLNASGVGQKDTIKVIYGLNDGFLRITLDSVKGYVYEKVL